MMTGDRKKGTGAPADGDTAMRYWGEMLRTTVTFWDGQLVRWSGALEQMRQGNYGGSEWLQDMVGSWDEWAAWMVGACQWGRPDRLLPTFLLVVDGDAEFVGPANAPTPVFLPAGVTIATTNLYQVGSNGAPGGGGPPGKHHIDAAAHVRVQLSPNRDQVNVSLVDLGRGKSERSKRGILPGLYVGAVHAKEVATPRSLAIIFVLVEESTVP